MTFVRRPEKFIGVDGVSTFTFPLIMLKWQQSQPLATAFVPLVGADYPADYQGANIAPKRQGTERISFWIISALATPTGLDVDTTVDNMHKVLINGALGKLYTVDDGAVERWSYARVAARPTVNVDPESRYAVRDVSCDFVRLSDWFASAATTGSQAVSATPTSFNITNGGNAICRTAVFTFTPTGAGALATNPKLFNLTTGYTQNFQYNTTAIPLNATTKRLKVDCENYTVLRSIDSGVTYPTNDYTNFVLPATQVACMELAPGVNSMQVTDGGTPSYTLSWSFFAPNH